MKEGKSLRKGEGTTLGSMPERSFGVSCGSREFEGPPAYPQDAHCTWKLWLTLVTFPIPLLGNKGVT